MPLRDLLPWDPRFYERSPLFEPLTPLARRFSGDTHFPSIARWNEVLGDGLTVRFQAQRPLPRGQRRHQTPRQPYSSSIQLESVVPSRPASWHDFFNALVWGTFVEAKRALHARQHAAFSSWAALDPTRLPNRRTRELDALALLDEGGVIVLTDAHPTTGMDAAELESTGHARVLVFGHAIYESLMLREAPPACRASAVTVRVDRLPGNPGALLEAADRGLATLLADGQAFQGPTPQPGLRLCLLPAP